MNDKPSKTAAAVYEMYPYLCVKDAGAAIEFYKRAFGATELFRLTEPSGRIGHAELKLGSAVLMIADEFPEYGISAPQGPNGAGVRIHLHGDDADALTRQAAKAVGTVIMQPIDKTYGYR